MNEIREYAQNKRNPDDFNERFDFDGEGVIIETSLQKLRQDIIATALESGVDQIKAQGFVDKLTIKIESDSDRRLGTALGCVIDNGDGKFTLRIFVDSVLKIIEDPGISLQLGLVKGVQIPKELSPEAKKYYLKGFCK